MELVTALRAHGDWRLKLRAALHDKAPLDPEVVSCDHACPLGEWLLGECKDKHGRFRSYAECVEAHAAFHREAGRIATAIQAGHYAEAEQLLVGNSAYAQASSAVGSTILTLRSEAGI